MDVKKVGQKIGKFFSLIDTFKEWKEAIKDLNTTNAQVVAGLAVGGLTAFFYFATMIVKMILAFQNSSVSGYEPPKIVHLDIFIAWLAFVASWIGFSVRQFKHKRETHFEEGQESVRHAQARNGGTK
jgi:hypothetical protein